MPLCGWISGLQLRLHRVIACSRRTSLPARPLSRFSPCPQTSQSCVSNGQLPDAYTGDRSAYDRFLSIAREQDAAELSLSLRALRRHNLPRISHPPYLRDVWRYQFEASETGPSTCVRMGLDLPQKDGPGHS